MMITWSRNRKDAERFARENTHIYGKMIVVENKGTEDTNPNLEKVYIVRTSATELRKRR